VEQHKLLDSFTGVYLAGIQIPLRIGYQLVHPMKLPGVTTTVPHLCHHRAVLAPHGLDHVVLSVRDQQKLLVFVVRKRELPNRSHSQDLCPHREFLNKLSLLGKNLHPVIHPVAHIYKSIPREVHTVHRVAKLWVGRRRRVVRARVHIVWRVAIGPHSRLNAPVSESYTITRRFM
jgi:hypothetical protein